MPTNVTVTIPGCGCEVDIPVHVAEGQDALTNDPHAKSVRYVEAVDAPDTCPSCGAECDAVRKAVVAGRAERVWARRHA